MKKPIYKDRFRNVIIDAIERRMVREYYFEPFIESLIEDFAPLLSDMQLEVVADTITHNIAHNPNTLNHSEWRFCAVKLRKILEQRKTAQHENQNDI